MCAAPPIILTWPPAMYDQVFDAPIIHLGGTGLLKKLDGAASVTLLKEAKKRGRTVTFDLIAASAETFGNVGPLLPYIDYFMPSIEEAKDMSGQSTAEPIAPNSFSTRVPPAACSPSAAMAPTMPTRTARRLKSPAYDIKIVDTTGCGDAFDAGFITSLHHKMDTETALRFAQASAGLVATGLGSDAGIVSFEDTLQKMKSWKIKS